MDLTLLFLLFIGGLVLFVILRVPIFISLLIVTFIVSAVKFGIISGPSLIMRSTFQAIQAYYLVTIPLFTLMGALLFHSGIAMHMINSISNIIGGSFRGRLCMIAIITGTLFGVLSGSALGAVAMLGALMIPDMLKSGYGKSISVGSILGAGGMSMVLPPSGVAIIVGTFGEMSIGRLLIGGLVPGIILAIFNLLVILIWAHFVPAAAPAFKAEKVPAIEKIKDITINILPIMAMVVALLLALFFGIATPNEASGLGVIGALILTIIYRKLKWSVLKQSMIETIRITGIIFIIMAAAASYTQLLALTGVSREFVNLFINLPISPTATMLLMILVVIFLGCFFEPISILMLVLPIYIPIATALGYDPIWLGLVFLINVDLAGLTPPFGLYLFTIKGIIPKDFTMFDVYKGAIPFAFADIATILVMLAYPPLFTWLPNLM